MTVRHAAAALIAVLELAVAACQSADTKFYALSTVPAAQKVGGPAQIAVGRIALPKYLDTSQIVRYDVPNRMTQAKFDQWAEPLGDMLSRVLTEGLSLRLPASKVFQEESFVTIPDAVTVDVDVIEFAAGPSGRVQLRARWMIRRPKAKNPVGPAQCFAATPDDNTVNGAVAAMSMALGEMSDGIAASLAGSPRPPSDCPAI